MDPLMMYTFVETHRRGPTPRTTYPETRDRVL